MTRPVVVVLAVCSVAVLFVPFSAGAPAGAGGAMAQPDGFDRSVFEITVYGNGSARWTLQHHRVLENQTEADGFRTFAERFRDNRTAVYRDFVTGAEVLASTGTNATGRQMEARAFSRDARVVVDPTFNDVGIVSMSFRWTNFAVTGDAVVVGDVFGDGLYLAPDQRLEFVAGPDLAFTEAAPESYRMEGTALQTSDSVWWTGQAQFGPSRPRVELQPASEVDGQVSTGSPAGPSGPGEAGGFMLLVAVFVVAVGVAGAAVWRARGPAALAALVRDVPLLSTDSDATTTEGTEEPAAAAGPASVSQDELLSDDDRVLQLLEENGGRMKQVNIVEETDWSKSKVSMLLSDMEDEGDISKLRVGRENIISLAGQEPDAAGSPFEDED